MEDKYLVTVDLGTSKIGLSVAKKSGGGKLEIVCYDETASNGIAHGKVQNTGKLSAVLKQALENTEKYLNGKITQVMVATQKYDLRSVDIDSEMEIAADSLIDGKNIDDLAELAWTMAKSNCEDGEEVYGVIAQSFDTDDEFNVNISDIIGMMSGRLTGKYKAFIGKTSTRNFIDAAFRTAGYPFSRTEFVGDIVGRNILTESEMDGGVALMDIGAGASSVSVFEGGVLRHYGAVPFGGDSVTGDISNLCDISEDLAENIKLAYGGCLPTRLASLGEKTLRIADKANGRKVEITVKYISEIITARFTEIFEALLYEIQKSGYKDKLRNGLVLIGGCANTLNIKHLVKDLSGYNVRIGTIVHNRFDAPVNFFIASKAQSAGLLCKCDEMLNESCVETERTGEKVDGGTTLKPLFVGPSDEKKTDEDIADTKDRQKDPGEKNAKNKESKRPQGSNGKNKGKTFSYFIGNLFGNDDDEENKL